MLLKLYFKKVYVIIPLNLIEMVWVLATETSTVAIIPFQRRKKKENIAWLRYID